jgi:hypothetical protein
MERLPALREVPLRRQLEDAVRTVDVVLAQPQRVRDLFYFSFPRGERRFPRTT